MKSPRISAKAVIIHDDKLLVIEKKDDQGSWYLLPGGGQDRFETLHEAVHRECMEEVNARVEVGRLLFIREYIARNHEFASTQPDVHQVEFMFLTKILNPTEVRAGLIPDDGQVGITWLKVSEVENVRLYPLGARKHIKNLPAHTLYLGDVN